jgi:hypothetical protein
MLLYKAMIDKKEVVLEEYKKVLKNLKTMPDPVKYVVKKLLDGQTVCPEEFIKSINEYIE